MWQPKVGEMILVNQNGDSHGVELEFVGMFNGLYGCENTPNIYVGIGAAQTISLWKYAKAIKKEIYRSILAKNPKNLLS